MLELAALCQCMCWSCSKAIDVVNIVKAASDTTSLSPSYDIALIVRNAGQCGDLVVPVMLSLSIASLKTVNILGFSDQSVQD